MPLFQYKAITETGKTRRGNLDASNIADLEQRLLRMGLDLITCRPCAAKKPLFGARKIRRADLINFCFHMEEMIAAGVPLLESLVDLRDSIEHPRFQEIITNIIDEVEGGKTLSAAMAEHPTVFDSLFINLILAGETTGEMGDVFSSLTKILKWQDELMASTKKLLIFPAFVGTVVLAVTFFLMVYLVPQLVSFIKEMKGTLPLHTRALIATSNFCIHDWYILLLVPAVLIGGGKILASRNQKFRRVLDDWKLKILWIGPVMKKILLSRFANFFSMMYAAGIPIMRCLEISEGIAGNLVIAEALQDVGARIKDGVGIAESFGNSGLFPPLVVRMIRIGENTGALDKALLNVSYFYDRDIQEAIGKIQAMIEPAMTVVLGMMLGWVMLSVLGPIYDTISKIKL